MPHNATPRRGLDPAGLMQNAPRAIAHLRAQNQKRRLGLIFGSGASKDLGFPDWSDLIDRIAARTEVEGSDILRRLDEEVRPKRSLAALTHVLFDHFRARRLGGAGVATSVPMLTEQRIKSDWLRIIHDELYRDIDQSERQRAMDAHPYLNAFWDIIKASPLTVNYNFDDTLEKLLHHHRTDEERTWTRGYEVIDRPNAQCQRDAGVIYHPNGFLPSEFADGSSAEIVFDSDSFQDQLIDAATGRYVHLSNHLFRNTCLLVGLSLEDGTLQSMLRQNAVRNPGHVHYVVHHMEKDHALADETRRAIFEANYTSYNLYTLFLDSAGIGCLADLIKMPKGDFDRFPPLSRKFTYYVVGSIGAGKSTATSNFRNLVTYDEWIDTRLPELAAPQKEIDTDTVVTMDAWIAEQFRKKNYALQKCSEGVHIIDRCPLDPLTFPGDRREKAQNLIAAITSGGHRIEGGHLIMLDCSIEELRLRNSLKHKYWSEDELNELVTAISEIYNGVEHTVVCTKGRSIAEVAAEIARVIFLADYRPIDVGSELRRHAEGDSV